MRLSIYNLWVAISVWPMLVLAAEPQAAEGFIQRLEMIQSVEAIIEFHGQVRDQFEQPIEGALVELSVSQATLLPRAPLTLHLVTDANGNFDVDPKKDSIKGSSISINVIKKDGYEFIYQGDRSGFDYRKNNPNRFVPDKSQPVIYRMRKKGIATFLFKEIDLRLRTEVKDSGKPIGYDFIKHYRITDMQNLVLNGEPVTCDLQVKATFNSNWEVVLSPGTTNGGIIVSTQLLYEAPETGYQPEYVFTPAQGEPVPAMYVYLKSRDPAIYTRLDIEHINADQDFFRLSGKSVTNPYGDRNLEQATDLPYAVIKLLTDGVEGAFRSGQRPSTPDLQQLLLPAQVRLEPEALAVSPGILTAFVRLPKEFPVSGITSATCDYAPAERMTLNKDKTEMIIKFRRKDIEAAVMQKGESLDTYFVVRGTWQGPAGTRLFQGADNITKIVGGKSK